MRAAARNTRRTGRGKLSGPPYPTPTEHIHPAAAEHVRRISRSAEHVRVNQELAERVQGVENSRKTALSTAPTAQTHAKASTPWGRLPPRGGGGGPWAWTMGELWVGRDGTDLRARNTHRTGRTLTPPSYLRDVWRVRHSETLGTIRGWTAAPRHSVDTSGAARVSIQ